jgi:hypothetical protein
LPAKSGDDDAIAISDDGALVAVGDRKQIEIWTPPPASVSPGSRSRGGAARTGWGCADREEMNVYEEALVVGGRCDVASQEARLRQVIDLARQLRAHR